MYAEEAEGAAVSDAREPIWGVDAPADVPCRVCGEPMYGYYGECCSSACLERLRTSASKETDRG